MSQTDSNLSDSQTLLGLLLANPTLLPEAAGVEASDLPAKAHARALEAIRRISQAGHELDLLSLRAELAAEEWKPEDLSSFLEALIAPRRETLEPFLTRVLDAAMARRALRIFVDTREELTAGELRAGEAVARAVERLSRLAETREGASLVEGAEMMREAGAAMESWMDPQGGGLSTGFTGLDRLGVRLSVGDVVILAGATSKGKSAIAGQIAYNVARAGSRVLFVSGEMSLAQMLRRFVSHEARHSLGTIKRNRDERKMLSDVTAAIARLPPGLVIADATRDTRLSRIVTDAQAAKARNPAGLQVLVLDYLGLLRLDDERGSITPYERITRLSREVKLAAGRLGVAVLLLAQLSRISSRREDQNSGPQLSDLRDSGAIEQDADSVVMIHRPAAEDGLPVEGRLIVRKNRNGPLGEVPIVFDGATFTTWEKDTEEATT